MKKYFGIDISKWQGQIDWNVVKNNIDFVIIRAGYGNLVSQKDEWFEYNYEQCKKYNIPCGVYWYSYADSVVDAQREASACLEVIKGKQFEYPIYFDIEDGIQASFGKDLLSQIVCSFCETIENNGYYVGVYSSLNWFENKLNNNINRYTKWIAQWNDKCTYNGDYHLWQYSSEGNIEGINGRVDLDISYVDFPTIIKTKFLNGYNKKMNVGSKVRVVNGAKSFKGIQLAPFVYSTTYDIISIDNNRVVIGLGRNITTDIDIKNLILIS